MAPKTILFATDLSCRCDRALDRASMLAAEWKAKLIVVHVLPEPSGASMLPSWRRPHDPQRIAFEQIGMDLIDKRGFEWEVVVDQGDPATAILKTAEEADCGLVITGVARNEILGRSYLGTSVEKLTRQADVPVLVVKSRPRGSYRNIVVGTDFSPGSRRALETVLTWLPESQTSLFHAYDVAFAGLNDNKEKAIQMAKSQAIGEAKEFLAATPSVAALQRSMSVYCEYGEPDELLRDMVYAKGFDLVALGNEGRSRLANVLIGSVAHRLLESLPVDVLIARKGR